MKPFAESCEQNKSPILAILKKHLGHYSQLLEIGSGTGQHAVYFAPEFPHLTWQPSDIKSNIDGIKLWLNEAGIENILTPLELDVSQQWPIKKYDAIYSSNVVHIMSWLNVQLMFMGISKVLQKGGSCLLYGPFNYQGEFTSESNANFDLWLKQKDPRSGIRNFEDILLLAQKAGMELQADYEMPANNRILCFKNME